MIDTVTVLLSKIIVVLISVTIIACASSSKVPKTPTEVETFVELEPRPLVNDAPAGVAFTVVTQPATPNMAIPLKVFRTNGAEGKPQLAAQTFNSVQILQNGVLNNELVTNEDGIAQGELLAGFGGQGEVELFFGTSAPIPIGITNPPKNCTCPEESGAKVDPHSGENSITETKVYAGFNNPRIPGRLIRTEDRNGNFMSFHYQTLIGTTQQVLTTAVDTMGRNIQFRYYSTNDPNLGRRGRLSEIEDFRRDGSSGCLRLRSTITPVTGMRVTMD